MRTFLIACILSSAIAVHGAPILSSQKGFEIPRECDLECLSHQGPKGGTISPTVFLHQPSVLAKRVEGEVIDSISRAVSKKVPEAVSNVFSEKEGLVESSSKIPEVPQNNRPPPRKTKKPLFGPKDLKKDKKPKQGSQPLSNGVPVPSAKTPTFKDGASASSASEQGGPSSSRIAPAPPSLHIPGPDTEANIVTSRLPSTSGLDYQPSLGGDVKGKNKVQMSVKGMTNERPSLHIPGPDTEAKIVTSRPPSTSGLHYQPSLGEDVKGKNKVQMFFGWMKNKVMKGVKGENKGQTAPATERSSRYSVENTLPEVDEVESADDPDSDAESMG